MSDVTTGGLKILVVDDEIDIREGIERILTRMGYTVFKAGRGEEALGILAKETHQNVIRFAPPLVIDRETLDWAIPRIREVLNIP